MNIKIYFLMLLPICGIYCKKAESLDTITETEEINAYVGCVELSAENPAQVVNNNDIQVKSYDTMRVEFLQPNGCELFNIEHQILSKKWRDRADREELNSLNHATQKTDICTSEVYNVIRTTLKEYYDIELGKNQYSPYPIEIGGYPYILQTQYLFRGDNTRIKSYVCAAKKHREHIYVMVTVKEPLEDAYTKILILISRTSREILSTTSFYVGTDRTSYRTRCQSPFVNRDNEYYYTLLLESELNGTNWSKYNKIGYDDVDSVTATNIALTVTEKHHSSGMLHIATKPMGHNKEHWMVFCFPNQVMNSDRHSGCYWNAINTYQCYQLAILDGKTCCPPTVTVLISRKNGQVLSMGKALTNLNYCEAK